VRRWLHAHPNIDAALGFQNEEHYVGWHLSGYNRPRLRGRWPSTCLPRR
jgi:hypothetical protein